MWLNENAMKWSFPLLTTFITIASGVVCKRMNEGLQLIERRRSLLSMTGEEGGEEKSESH